MLKTILRMEKDEYQDLNQMILMVVDDSIIP